MVNSEFKMSVYAAPECGFDEIRTKCVIFAASNEDMIVEEADSDGWL